MCACVLRYSYRALLVSLSLSLFRVVSLIRIRHFSTAHQNRESSPRRTETRTSFSRSLKKNSSSRRLFLFFAIDRKSFYLHLDAVLIFLKTHAHQLERAAKTPTRSKEQNMLLCAISGEQTAKPVIAPSGHVFERSLIEKLVKETGENPMTKQPLSVEDLIPINTDVSAKNIKPRATAHASIPGLLQTFHDEYDGLMLELYETRKRLGESERELASMAYQVDAANRTVARLVKERDEARAMVASGGGGCDQNDDDDDDE